MVNVIELKKLIANNDKDGLVAFMKQNPELCIKDGKIIVSDKKEIKARVELLDGQQMVKKTGLNALYGSLLQISSRFFDERLGQSTTLSGRCIAKHMNSHVNECITGEYKVDGDAIQYIDTDSCQFTAYPILKSLIDSGELEWTKEIAVQLYEEIAEKTNASFPAKMHDMFNCPKEKGELIKAGFESLGSRGLYLAKKRYAILNYYKDGRYLDKPKLKAMGLEIKRSDTPKMVQNFLEELLYSFLSEGNIEIIINKINDFKDKFRNLQPYEQGTPKRANNIANYEKAILAGTAKTVPGHVRAAINWNTLKKINNDTISQSMLDGTKCIVCPLKKNMMGMTSVAYPVDESNLPQWFKNLPFDTFSMMETVVEKKIQNLFGVVEGWKQIEEATRKVNTFEDFFS